MTNPANVRSVLDVPCTHVAPNTEQCGALVGNPCMGPDLLPCPAHPERIAAARLHYGIADLPDLPMPFSEAQRADVLDAVIDDPTPPRAMALVREHFLRTAAMHGVRPGEPRGDRSAQDHMRGLDRHLLRMARLTGTDYDLDAIDEDTGALQLVAVACRALLALERREIEREARRG